MIDILHIALLTFLFLSIIATVFFVYRYASLRGRIPSIVQEEFELWRRREEMMMQDKVRNRFEEWRDREVKAIQATLQKEALIQAHSLFKDWSQNELEAMRREQREIAHREATTDLIKWKHEQEKIIRLDAVQRSQAVTIGKVTEHIVPYLPNFDFNPKDVRFIGSPVDFVVFDGLNDDEENQVRNVIFVEIKTGMSVLTRREKLVRDAIKAGRVRWVEWFASRDLHQAVPGLFE